MNPVAWWTPWRDLLQTGTTMDRLFDEFFGYGGNAAPGRNGAPPTYALPIDVVENDAGYVITASVPGFAPEQVEVTFNEGVLTVFAKAEPRQIEGQWLRQERPYGSLARKLELTGVQGSDITANFDNGVLTVMVPKTPQPQPVKIPIGTGQKQLSAKS